MFSLDYFEMNCSFHKNEMQMMNWKHSRLTGSAVVVLLCHALIFPALWSLCGQRVAAFLQVVSSREIKKQSLTRPKRRERERERVGSNLHSVHRGEQILVGCHRSHHHCRSRSHYTIFHCPYRNPIDKSNLQLSSAYKKWTYLPNRNHPYTKIRLM